jgi:hypothetical protein
VEILLCPVPEDPRYPGVPVGRVGDVGLAKLKGAVPEKGKVLSYVARQPYIDGEPVDPAEIGQSMIEAVERSAGRLFGDLWVGPLQIVTGLGQRTVQRDRIRRYALPTPALLFLGRSLYVDHPRAVGYLMLSVATMWDDIGRDDPYHASTGALTDTSKRDLDRRLQSVMRAAQDLVEEIREETGRARMERLNRAGDTES